MNAWIWAILLREYSSDDVLVEIQTQGQVNLLSGPGAAKTRVQPFHLDYGVDDFFRWSIGSWFTSTAW
jgi:hypothetical protein